MWVSKMQTEYICPGACSGHLPGREIACSAIYRIEENLAGIKFGGLASTGIIRILDRYIVCNVMI